MSSLILTEGAFDRPVVHLHESDVLGRSFDSTVRLDDPSVSRHHAKISLVGGNYLIEDLGSGRGTFVNGERISAPTALKEGDRIRLADFVFRFAGEADGLRDSSVTIVDPPAGKDTQPILETLDVNYTLAGAVMGQRTVEGNALLKAQQQFRTVLEIGNAIQTELDLDKLLNRIMERLFGVFPQADRGFILLKADEGDALVPHVARQRGKGQPEAITLSRSIVRKALEDRVAILSADAMSDQRFSMAVSVMNFRIRSMMCAPIIAHDDALGVIHLDTTRQDQRFTLDDLDLLAAVTNQVAFAVANARMHRRLLLQERTARDLQLARQVQESFLPRQFPKIAGMQFCASYKAALEVGGDFYDFIPLAGDRLGIVVGDISGKGIPAALMMARMSSAVREFAQTEDEPRAVLGKLNGRMASMNAGDSFLTVIFAVLNPAARALRMANAAHPPPILRRRSTGLATEIQVCTNFPVGAVDDAEFEQEDFQLAPGDLVCFYSDGITEAMNAAGELYGSARLKAAAARPAASAQELMDNILKDLHAHVGGAYQSDDFTIVCFGAT